MRDYLLHGEELPLIGKISPAACQGYRYLRATCPCCGGGVIRRATRKEDKHSLLYKRWVDDPRSWRDCKHLYYKIPSKGHKPRYKNHRRM